MPWTPSSVTNVEIQHNQRGVPNVQPRSLQGRGSVVNVESRPIHSASEWGIEARISPMSGKYRALFLMAVIFWQSLAVLSSLSLVQHAREETHQTQGELHAFYQHHVDQTVHKNGEADAVAHSHAGAVTDIAAVIGSESMSLSVFHPQLASGALAVELQTPVLAGPLRPPKHLT
jgi:hypothetical protein